MPYRDREQQLIYMRNYMKRKRMVDRLARLKQRKQQVLQDYEEDHIMRVLYSSREQLTADIDSEIDKLEGLLRVENKVVVLGGRG